MLFFAALLLAQTGPATCAAMDAGLPAALAGWTQPGKWFGPGKAVVFNARDGAFTFGFGIVLEGIYGIALDQPGWVEVVPLPRSKAAVPLASISHEHGPECSSIRKIVWFRLKPGAYEFVVTRLKGTRAKAMLIEGE